MYNRPFRNNNRQRQFSRGNRRQTSINPSLLIKSATVVPVVQEPVAIKHQFSDFPIADNLKRNIIEKGYIRPTPIQDQVIPVALEGKDVVGIANTGTGKTAAFLIPLIQKLLSNPSEKVLIVAPTRELAVQIQDEVKAFVKGMQIYSVLCIGGVGLFQQISNLRRNPPIVIGTPGRLKDLKNQGKLYLGGFTNVVLDEVDRMLDMGFIADVRFLLSFLPRNRQSMFFSATLSHQISEIIKNFSYNPVQISVKSQETASNVEQDIVKTNGKQKIDVLHDLLAQEGFGKVIIFGRTKWGIKKIAEQLMRRGFRVAELHGNKNQNQRQKALDSFRRNEVSILLATDIASRGLDIDDVTHVINYDLPATYEDYIHRIGRTGRAEKKGIALSFVD